MTSTNDTDDDLANRKAVVEHALRRLIIRYSLHGKFEHTPDGGMVLRINPLPPRRPKSE